ncbi:peptidoglycan DD-metalloendopeptidase family protein [Leptospira borgpetersenii]|uniref:peptidoglycan DD-metalloendopeptidase family protein n=2 Tax=Leptospira borgpetersenii TaxID=174 RepID=UPI0021594B55|nr:peptidoglycan DD-metalloendopeptidase family protein [Leptospira borgpetersenii]UVD72872.1 peptidoglycan DD-metalloendopeptidase family protein [Leptospira borgpetersenii]UZW32624.1 peptidoglycan DD-metalloendopeptidase family protein [Leptospira borgpetersenii]
MRQHNSPKNQTELNLQEPHFCDLETNKSNSEYLEPAFRRQKTDELRVQRTEDGRQRTETGELLHHGFGMQFTFRRQKRDGLASLVLDRGQKETEELLHHGFGIQLTETEKKTALWKQNIPDFRNRFSFKTKIVSFFTILSFNISFVIPLTVFSFLFSSSSPLDAQSVPTLGSTKQFANDELKPYVDAAKAGATDSGTFLNSVNNGEQVLEAAWETGVNAEIEAIVGGVNNSDTVNNVNVYKDAVRAQLELQKQQAKNQWIADVNAYIQAELQIFLATLSQNTSNNVTSTNTNSVQTINPTVQNVTTTPVSQNTNPAQAAQSYYQGSQLWNSKWQDLLTKQNTWEQNSLNAIQNGILQWNQSITGLENDKLSYLNGIEQTKAQWLANKQLITNAQSQMRNALQSTITNIRSQENQLKANAASDPSLTSVFGDMDELLEDLQDALNSNASLGTLAQTLGNFFQSQISNATAKADYWNITKWQETYATQVLEFKKEVGTASLSCSGSSSCNNLSTIGPQAITYGSDGNIYGWGATNGGFQNGVLISTLDPYTTANPAYQMYQSWIDQQIQSCSGNQMICSILYGIDLNNPYANNPYSPTYTVTPNNTSGYYSTGHYEATCNGADIGGTCFGGSGAYALDLNYCGGGLMCGYSRQWITDDSYTTTVTESFNQAQKDQIATNTKIRNAVYGNYNTAFGLSSQAGNAVSNSSVALETKVWLGGNALNSSNWYNSLGLIEQVQVQTKYKYIDTAMQANQNFWTSMKTQFTNIASTFLSLVNPLKDWEERSQTYEQEYQAKLLELEQTKQSTVANYNNQISLMKAARGAWVTEVYGYQMAGIEGSADNANSQFRTGQENWNDTISIFQQAELNWYLSAKDTLEEAVSGSPNCSPAVCPVNGETQFQTNATSQANQLQTQITNSETNTTNLYNAATGLYQTYQYSAAGNVMQQAITNLQNQTSWNGQGANLSQSIADSFGRSEAYKTAELNASNRINALAQTIYGNGAYIVDNTELQTLQTQITTNGQNQTFWQNEINGTNGGFNFNGRRTASISTTLEYTNIRNDIAVATTLQTEVVDEERGYLKTANEFFEKSEKYQELADKARNEAKFDEAALYTGYAVREKSNAIGFLKKKYYSLGEEITSEIDNRGLTYTKNSFLSYRDNLLNKNFQNSTQVQKQIQEGKNQVAGIISEGESYNQIQGMIQTAANLNKQGEENKTRVERLLLESKELANRNIGEGLLDGLQEMIASIQSALPQEVSNNGVAQYIQAQEKELEEKQKKADELLSHMNLLVTNNNDLAALQTLLQGSSQAINLAANSAVSKYLDDYAKKLQKDNEERSANLQKTLLEALTNGDEYKYLREAGYSFRTDGEGISAYRQIYSGEIEIDGSAMKSTSYSPDLEYQYIRMETKFNPGNLSVDMMNPNATRFNAEMVLGVKNYIDNLQKNVETMLAQFSNKTNEIKEEYAENQEIEDYKKELYKENRDGYLIAFQGLQKELGYAFGQEMLGSMTYYEKGSQYNFGESGSSHIPKMATKGSVPKNGKPEYESLPTIDTTFVGERELKGTVNIKGIPVEMNYGMQHLAFTEEFDLSKLSYNFNLKGLGTGFAEQQLSVVNQKYSQYLQGVQADLEKQAKKNDEERDSKGFLFNVLNGMSGGQKVGQAVEGEIRSRVTGAIAEATGLPASFVGALVGGSNMKQAMKAYEKSMTTEAISQATGIPAWYLNQKIAEKEATHEMAKSFSYNVGRAITVAAVAMSAGTLGVVALAMNQDLMSSVNKFADHIGKEAYKNRETIDTAITVAASATAIVSGGMSLVALAAYKTAQGAVAGGALGALAGAATIGNAPLSIVTGGMVSYDISYSYEKGFGASVGGGMKLMEGLGVGATLSYNEQTGFGASAGLQAGTSALSFNAGISYSEQGGISANAGLGLGMGKNGTTGSYASTLNLGMSYNRNDGFGTSVGISRNNNVVLPGVGATISRSEFGGWGADVSSDQYGSYEGKGGKYGGVSGGLSWNEHTGLTLSLNSGGTNAFNYNAQSGLTSNSNFLAESAMNNGLSQGVAETPEEKAYAAAKAKADSRAAQNRNNQESGKSALDAIGYSTTRREDGLPGSQGTIGFGDADGPNPAHGTSSHDPGQTLTSSGSFGPDGEPTGGRQLSAADVAEFKADWRKESPAQTDANIAGLKAAGYDTSGLEKFVNDYRNQSKPGYGNSNQTGSPIVVNGSRTSTLGERAGSLFGSIADGASSFWNRIVGGGSKPVLNSNSLSEGSYNYKPSKESNGVLKPLADGAIIPGKGYNVTSEFGSRPDPFNPTGPTKNHRGIDIAMPTGTPVFATAPGKVIFSGTQNNGSKEVHIDHGGGLVSIFKHNSELLVQNNHQVVRGELITRSGNTGPSTGPHLHYELKLNGVVQNPANFNIRDWATNQ